MKKYYPTDPKSAPKKNIDYFVKNYPVLKYAKEKAHKDLRSPKIFLRSKQQKNLSSAVFLNINYQNQLIHSVINIQLSYKNTFSKKWLPKHYLSTQEAINYWILLGHTIAAALTQDIKIHNYPPPKNFKTFLKYANSLLSDKNSQPHKTSNPTKLKKQFPQLPQIPHTIFNNNNTKQNITPNNYNPQYNPDVSSSISDKK